MKETIAKHLAAYINAKSSTAPEGFEFSHFSIGLKIREATKKELHEIFTEVLFKEAEDAVDYYIDNYKIDNDDPYGFEVAYKEVEEA
jgi:hypothetical protein